MRCIGPVDFQHIAKVAKTRTVHSASTGGTNKGKDWGMKQERRTPQYTTRWEDVPVARA